MGKTIRNGKTITEGSVVKGGGSTKDFIQDWINAGGGFGGSPNLTDEDLEGVDFSKRASSSLNYMFAGCTKLTNLDLSNLDLSKTTGYKNAFANCSKMVNIKLPNQGGIVISMAEAFNFCQKLESVDLSCFNLQEVSRSVRNLTRAFYLCRKLKNVGVPEIVICLPRETKECFYYCQELETPIRIISWQPMNNEDAYQLFMGCQKVPSIIFEDNEDNHYYTSTRRLTSMSRMFYDCSSLTSIDLSKFDTSNVTDMSAMFHGCNLLTNLNLSNWNTSNVTGMGSMFSECSSLTEIPALNMSNVTNLIGIFYNCSSLTAIHCTGMKVEFDISSSTLFTREALLEIINNCTTVTTTQTLEMGEENLAKLTDEDKEILTNKGWTLA